MNTENIFSMRRTLAARQRKHLSSFVALGLTCALLPCMAFAQNTSTDPDPDVEAGSYIALNVDQDIVATGDPITGTASIYEGDGDVDSDDPIETASFMSAADLGYTETANGTVTFTFPTNKYGDITITSSSADAKKVQKIIHSVSVNTKTTPSDNFSGRSQTTYGVGEVVGLWTEPHFPYQWRESTFAGTGQFASQFVKLASNSVGGK